MSDETMKAVGPSRTREEIEAERAAERERRRPYEVLYTYLLEHTKSADVARLYTFKEGDDTCYGFPLTQEVEQAFLAYSGKAGFRLGPDEDVQVFGGVFARSAEAVGGRLPVLAVKHKHTDDLLVLAARVFSGKAADKDMEAVSQSSPLGLKLFFMALQGMTRALLRERGESS